MSTPIADHLRAIADRLADLARDGATPAQLTAHAVSLGLMALKVARLERAMDEIVADAMGDELQRHQRERHQAIIDSLLATHRCHLAQRRPGQTRTNQMSQTTPITLSHGQNIRIASWANTISASVFTTRGYAIENGQCPDAMVARARGFGHDLVGTIYHAGALVGDRALAMKLAAEERARAEGATVLADGDTVEIEGALYRVKVMRGNSGRFPTNCDPIHFKPL